MIRVGVIGLGMMGTTHLNIHAKQNDVQVVAISDIDPKRLSGEELAMGNIDGQTGEGFDIRHADVKRYDEGRKLIRSKQVDLVDICLPTTLHVPYARSALRAGKHVMVEKPMGRTFRDAKNLLKTAAESDGFIMVGQCMRFWPGWTWLKEAVTRGTYGDVMAATFRRVSSFPGGPYYLDGRNSGGALLDLHIHDTDCICWLFGTPMSVTSVGYTKITGEIDHLVTRYEYRDVPLVSAEGGWAMSEGFGFSMKYTVNFENATADFDIGADKPLTVYEKGAAPRTIDLEPGMGYDHEIRYLLDCIRDDTPPTTVTLDDAALSVKIADAEQRSAMTGRTVKIR